MSGNITAPSGFIFLNDVMEHAANHAKPIQQGSQQSEFDNGWALADHEEELERWLKAHNIEIFNDSLVPTEIFSSKTLMRWEDAQAYLSRIGIDLDKLDKSSSPSGRKVGRPPKEKKIEDYFKELEADAVKYAEELRKQGSCRPRKDKVIKKLQADPKWQVHGFSQRDMDKNVKAGWWKK